MDDDRVEYKQKHPCTPPLQYTSRAAQLYKQLLEKEANKLASAGVVPTSPSAAQAELAALALDAAATSNGKVPEEDAAPPAEEAKPTGW